MSLKRRVERIEGKMNPGDSVVVFRETGNTDEEKAASVTRQWVEYLASGGNPHALQVIIKSFATAENYEGGGDLEPLPKQVR